MIASTENSEETKIRGNEEHTKRTIKIEKLRNPVTVIST